MSTAILPASQNAAIVAAGQAANHYAAAGATMARAIARAVYAATPAANDIFPVWSSRPE